MIFYTCEIKIPQTKREGLENFIRMIINQIEAGNSQEALLKAVDLLEDVRCGTYDDAMADAKGYSAVGREMQRKHSEEITAASKSAYARGVDGEKERMAKQLGLLAA